MLNQFSFFVSLILMSANAWPAERLSCTELLAAHHRLTTSELRGEPVQYTFFSQRLKGLEKQAQQRLAEVEAELKGQREAYGRNFRWILRGVGHVVPWTRAGQAQADMVSLRQEAVELRTTLGFVRDLIEQTDKAQNEIVTNPALYEVRLIVSLARRHHSAEATSVLARLSVGYPGDLEKQVERAGQVYESFYARYDTITASILSSAVLNRTSNVAPSVQSIKEVTDLMGEFFQTHEAPQAAALAALAYRKGHTLPHVARVETIVKSLRADLKISDAAAIQLAGLFFHLGRPYNKEQVTSVRLLLEDLRQDPQLDDYTASSILATLFLIHYQPELANTELARGIFSRLMREEDMDRESAATLTSALLLVGDENVRVGEVPVLARSFWQENLVDRAAVAPIVFRVLLKRYGVRSDLDPALLAGVVEEMNAGTDASVVGNQSPSPVHNDVHQNDTNLSPGP